MLLILFFGVGCDDRILVSGGFQVDVQFCKLPLFLGCNFFHSFAYSYAIARMYYTSPSPIFHIYIHLYFQILGGQMNRTNYLFLLYHYSKFTYLLIRTFFLSFSFAARIYRHPLLCYFFIFLQDTFQQASIHFQVPTSKGPTYFEFAAQPISSFLWCY